MAEVNKEVNEMVAANEAEAVTAQTEEVEVVSEEVNDVPELTIERSEFISNKRKYWSYFINGVLRGRNIKVELVPNDNGGYEMLDLVFGNDTTAKLSVTRTSMRDKDTNRKVYITSYEAYNIDEDDGSRYHTPIKPARKSDASALEQLLERLK